MDRIIADPFLWKSNPFLADYLLRLKRAEMPLGRFRIEFNFHSFSFAVALLRPAIEKIT